MTYMNMIINIIVNIFNYDMQIVLESQCSPYQAVTGKIYHLKQNFLLPATA